MPLRRRRLLVAAAGIAVASIALVAVVEWSLTQPEILIPGGEGSNGQFGVQNFTYNVNVPEPGRLTGSWWTPPISGGPRFTTMLFAYSDCIQGNYGGPASCSGTPAWAGASDASHDAINLTVSQGFYVFLWEAPNASEAPSVVIATPVTLEPAAWWWV